MFLFFPGNFVLALYFSDVADSAKKIKCFRQCNKKVDRSGCSKDLCSANKSMCGSSSLVHYRSLQCRKVQEQLSRYSTFRAAQAPVDTSRRITVPCLVNT